LGMLKAWKLRRKHRGRKRVQLMKTPTQFELM
jgi:hypothetical protein